MAFNILIDDLFNRISDFIYFFVKFLFLFLFFFNCYISSKYMFSLCNFYIHSQKIIRLLVEMQLLFLLLLLFFIMTHFIGYDEKILRVI